MDVLIVGGNGFIGTHLGAELVERGHEVTALGRTASESDLPAGVEPYDGDVTDYAAIEGAFEGKDAVVNLVALSPLFKPKGGYRMHERVHTGGTRNALDAATEHGIERFVHMSAFGADPDATTAYLRAKGKAENTVMDSDRDWVVFRPSVVFGEGDEFVGFTKKLSTPYLTGLPGGGKTPFQPIWIGDFAPMLADAVEDDEHVGQDYDIGGPEVLTMAEVAKLGYRAEGKPLTVLPVPMPLAKVGLGVAGAVPFIPFGLDQARSLQLDNRIPDNDVDAFGVEESDLRTLADYLGLEP